MEIQKEKISETKIKLTISLPQKDWQDFKERAFLRLSSDFNIKGFRPGKAPKELIEDRIGKDKLFQEALEMAIPETYFQALQKEKIKAVSDPEIKITQHQDEKPLEYSAVVEIIPEYDLPAYHQIKLKKKKIKISPKETEITLENFRKARADYQKVLRPAQKGDKIEIDFEGFLDRVKIEQLVSKNHPLILGEGGFVPGFEDELVGLKKAETKEFDLKMPENLRDKNLAGKKIQFKVKVSEVWEVILPKLDDQFAEKISNAKFKTLEDLKKDTQNTLEKRAEMAEKRRLETELVNNIADKTNIDLPESLVKREQERLVLNMRHEIESRGLAFSDYLTNIGKKEEELMADLRKQAGKTVKVSLVMSEIIKKEKIRVQPAEIEKELEILKKAQVPIEDEDRARHELEHHLEYRKAVEKLLKLAVNS